jgi:hypothetical protein
MNFDELAKETMAVNNYLQNRSSLKEMDPLQTALDFSFSKEATETVHVPEVEETQADEGDESDYEQEEEVGLEVPERPGVLFYIDQGVNTFCIRGEACEDLQWSFEEWEKGSEYWNKRMKSSCEDCLSEVLFAPTSSFEEAEVLSDTLFNRRYPRQEELLCNLSDPGFSWWMNENEGQFQIYFQSHGIERKENYVQLGPLGDPLIVSRRFKKSLPLLKKHFAVNEFSVTEKAFAISSVHLDSPEFVDLKEIFLTGIMAPDLFPSEDETMILFFKEMALLRRFWLKIEELLNQEVQ